VNKFMRWLDIETLEGLKEWAEGNGRHGDLELIHRYRQEVSNYCRRKQGRWRWSILSATEHMREDIKDHFSPCDDHLWDYGMDRIGTLTYVRPEDR